MTWLARLFLVALCLSHFCSPNIRAQARDVAPLRFELAIVKPARSDARSSNLNFNHGNVTIENFTMFSILKVAYALNTGSDDQIVGAPAWVKTIAYDIMAKPDEATARQIASMTPDDQERAIVGMLRTLMQERFSLKAHFEDQPRTVAALVRTKNGSKLAPFRECTDSEDAPCQHRDWQGLHNSDGHIEGRGSTMATLANVLSMQPDVGGRLVVDATDLPGKFNFDLRYTPDGSQAAPGPSLFSALQEQLGLKLETKRLPIKVLVIDRVSTPSPN
jgi:uncharacterized protein (TIGR03435 family)